MGLPVSLGDMLCITGGANENGMDEECVKERGNGSMVFTPSFNPWTKVGYLYYNQV